MSEVKPLFVTKNVKKGQKNVRLLNIKRPRLKQVLLEKPKGLTDIQSAVWDFIAKELADNYLSEKIDAFYLRIFCETVEEYYTVCVKLKEEGYVSEDDKGNKKINPLYYVKKDLYNSLLRFAQEFGLTPKARKKFTVARNAKIEEQGFEELNKVEKDELYDLMNNNATEQGQKVLR